MSFVAGMFLCLCAVPLGYVLGRWPSRRQRRREAIQQLGHLGQPRAGDVYLLGENGEFGTLEIKGVYEHGYLYRHRRS